jgi:hypothetical protein
VSVPFCRGGYSMRLEVESEGGWMVFSMVIIINAMKRFY